MTVIVWWACHRSLGVVVELGNDEIVFDRVKTRDGIAQWHKVKEKSACTG